MFYKKNEVCEHVWRLKSATNQINDDEFAEKWLNNSDVFDADNKLQFFKWHSAADRKINCKYESA